MLGCSGENRFEFIVSDDHSSPLSGVVVFYYDDAQDSVYVGFTDSLGSIIIPGEHLQPARQYLFAYEPPAATTAPRFDPQLCAILSATPEGKYYSHRRDGTIAAHDLSGRLLDRKWPGRQITLEFVPDSYLAPAHDNDEGSEGVVSSLERILKITTTPGAGISINREHFRLVPASGKLIAPFCPGDSAACFASTVRIMLTKDYFKQFDMEMSLPDPGDTLVIRQQLRSEETASDEGDQADRPVSTPIPAEPAPVVVVKPDVEVVITAVKGQYFFVNATVFIDGQKQADKTPYTFYLKPGPHNIRAEWEENGVTQKKSQTIKVQQGMTPKIVFRFEE